MNPATAVTSNSSSKMGVKSSSRLNRGIRCHTAMTFSISKCGLERHGAMAKCSKRLEGNVRRNAKGNARAKQSQAEASSQNSITRCIQSSLRETCMYNVQNANSCRSDSNVWPSQSRAKSAPKPVFIHNNFDNLIVTALLALTIDQNSQFSHTSFSFLSFGNFSSRRWHNPNLT